MQTSQDPVQFPREFSLELALEMPEQGERFTCVAFSVVALLEYVRGASMKRLSPQYLYTRCKHDDPMAPGTSIQCAFECVENFGVCTYECWPYDHNAEEGSEYQVDARRLSEIPVERFDDVTFHLLYTPRNVVEYKSILTGFQGKRPMPVVTGMRVFESGRTSQNGWFTLPSSPDENSNLHAVLIYGYKDTPGCPSKGYFLALNSWGRKWAPLAQPPGVAKIPYEYIQQYALESGTVFQVQEDVEDLPSEEASTPALAVSAQAASAPLPVGIERDDFYGTIKKNMSSGIYPCPTFTLSFWQRVYVGMYPFASRSMRRAEMNLDNDFQDFLRRRGMDCGKVFASVFRIGGGGRKSFRLVLAFFEQSSKEQVTVPAVDALHEFIDNRYEPARKLEQAPTIQYVYVIGTNTSFSDDCQATCQIPQCLCTYRSPGVWDLDFSSISWSGRDLLFMRHVVPVDASQCSQAVMEALCSKQFDGPITLDMLRSELRLSRSLPDCFLLEWLDLVFQSGKFAKDSSGGIHCLDNPNVSLGSLVRTRRYTANSRQIWRSWQG